MDTQGSLSVAAFCVLLCDASLRAARDDFNLASARPDYMAVTLCAPASSHWRAAGAFAANCAGGPSR
jgi:hypothetical protein